MLITKEMYFNLCICDFHFFGPISQTGLSLSYEFVKLRYLENFDRNAFEDNISVHLDTEYILRCQSKIFSVETVQTCILVRD